MKIKYRKRNGFHVKAPAVVIALVIMEVEKEDGCATPERILEVSTPKRAPLHNEFEWDDCKCGHNWRLEQARQIIRCLEVVGEDGEAKPEMIFCSAVENSSGEFYKRGRVMNNKELYAIALRDAVSYLWEARRKYVDLTELEPVWREIEKLRARQG